MRTAAIGDTGGGTAASTSSGMRRRAAAAAIHREDSFPGVTTEEETGFSDDPREPPTGANTGSEGGEKLMSRARIRKMTVRSLFGTAMMITFSGVIYLGHMYVCVLVFALQCFIFSELVGVRKKQAAERRLPLFRSLQWAWFFVAAFFTWSANVCEFLVTRPMQFGSTRWSAIARLVFEKNMMVSFSLYTVLLIVSVLSLRKGLYKYQITQYTWTIISICIVVFQTQAVFQIVYAGMFWFVLPSSLVICNDIMAYFCGQFFGKKIIRRRFLELSPNKTWEGFLGAAVCTLFFAFRFSGMLCHSKWMTCIPDDLTFVQPALDCVPSPIYQLRPLRSIAGEATPEWAWELVTLAAQFAPRAAATIGSVELYSAQLHALCLALFASFAAPFGGFLSSAIKRAYGIKDFNNLIPGHGGMMDRFDCQFVMFLCTFVHHRTFCHSPVSVASLLGSAGKLSLVEQQELLRRLSERLAVKGSVG